MDNQAYVCFSNGFVKWKAPKVKRAFLPTWPASLQIYRNRIGLEHKHSTNMAAVLPNGQRDVIPIVGDLKMANLK